MICNQLKLMGFATQSSFKEERLLFIEIGSIDSVE